MKTSTGGGDDGRLAVADPVQHPRHVVGRQLAVTLRMGLKLLEDLGGAGHRLVFAANVDAAVAGRNAHPQRIADPPHVLIAGAKQGYQDLGTDDRNGGFIHPSRGGILAAALTIDTI